MSEPIRAADVLARRLYDAGCRTAFGMPGGEVLSLIDALRRNGIDFVLVRHENAGGFMAEGNWHVTGAPGILVATLGPGALNAVNTVANALQERVPLVVLTGCVDAAEAERYSHQIIDHQAVFRPVTKATLQLNAEAAEVVADRAVSIACEPQAGPVHVDVPMGVAEMPVSPRSVRRSIAAPAAPPVGPGLDRARDWLARAERPLLVAGVDALNEAAGPAVTAFAEAHAVPVVTTYRAKGLIPEDHPLSLGGAGLSPLADSHLLPLVRSADLIFLAGYDPIEMRPGWRDVWDPTTQNVLDIVPVPRLSYMHGATLTVQSGVSQTLAALSKGVPPRGTWTDGAFTATRTDLARAFSLDEEWGPGAVVDCCRAALPEDGIATVDSGAHRILLSQMWTCPAPRTLLQSAGLCTMGCAVPLALGAQMAAPERKVIAFTGDAGFLMVAGELATAAELDLRTVIVVFVDASLALIEKKQRERQLPNLGVDFAVHDYAAIGRAFGGHGATVSTRAGLRSALDAAFGADRFTVIAAMIERGAYDGRI
ncbi:MAG: thiamine pyrophosphate-binding protein [Rhodobacteraceae bacterium]|nr:thiamine pyrophosphate-binding protein [Paracoccaceae bacterium]